MMFGILASHQRACNDLWPTANQLLALFSISFVEIFSWGFGTTEAAAYYSVQQFLINIQRNDEMPGTLKLKHRFHSLGVRIGIGE